MAPLVSAIIIFRDQERYLGEAIESVRAQTGPEWELLLVDDGSVDAGGQLAQTFVEEDPGRIRLLRHPAGISRGASASRNLGIAHSQGRYLAFLDGDDVWLPGKLERQIPVLERWPHVDVVLANSQYWYSWSGRFLDRFRNSRLRLPVTADTPIPGLDLLLACFPLGPGPPPFTCDLVVRRSLLNQIGAFEEEFTDLFDDQVFLVKAYLEASFVVCSQPCSRYRRRRDSTCGRAAHNGEYERVRKIYLDWVGRYFARRGLAEASPAWTAWRRAQET